MSEPWSIRDEVAHIADIHGDGHGVWTAKEWRAFTLAVDMLDWQGLLAILDARPALDVEALDAIYEKHQTRRAEHGDGDYTTVLGSVDAFYKEVRAAILAAEKDDAP